MNVNDYSPLALAFIGDAHYNMIVKRHVIDHEVKMDRMQKLATKYVSAKAQARIMEHLLQLNILTEEEIDYAAACVEKHYNMLKKFTRR